MEFPYASLHEVRSAPAPVARPRMTPREFADAVDDALCAYLDGLLAPDFNEYQRLEWVVASLAAEPEGRSRLELQTERELARAALHDSSYARFLEEFRHDGALRGRIEDRMRIDPPPTVALETLARLEAEAPDGASRRARPPLDLGSRREPPPVRTTRHLLLASSAGSLLLALTEHPDAIAGFGLEIAPRTVAACLVAVIAYLTAAFLVFGWGRWRAGVAQVAAARQRNREDVRTLIRFARFQRLVSDPPPRDKRWITARLRRARQCGIHQVPEELSALVGRAGRGLRRSLAEHWRSVEFARLQLFLLYPAPLLLGFAAFVFGIRGL